MSVLTGRPGRESVSSDRNGAAGLPGPMDGERPAAYADRVGEWYTAKRSDRQRRDHGLFLTPVPAADFMARRITSRKKRLRVLDPAAGAGVLCCAAVEALLSRRFRPDSIELVSYEVDENLTPVLRAVLDYLTRWCREQHGVSVRVLVRATDFILANADALRPCGLFSCQREAGEFDAVIANPPYFKIGKSDPRAAAVANVVHGQPNIYALFMALGAALLRRRGDLVFITPRSFASGPYFRRFRTVFFDMIRPTWVHVFGSRRNAFQRDAVLQENVILCGIRQDRWHQNTSPSLSISTSLGIEDIPDSGHRKVPMDAVLNLKSLDRILRMPTCDEDDDVLALVDSWPTNLQGLGLNISTGPVVPFRATKLVASEGKVPASHAPLLWMNHVRAMRATWPIDRHKPEYIKSAEAGPLLVPNRNYVFLRRFSAKEEVRRLTAAPWIAADFPISEVGLENHLNYVHRPGGTLSENEAWGLAALYNSQLLDTWFRAVNGNTQVSATELRAMPLPGRKAIVALGRRVRRLADPMAGLDSRVVNMVGPSRSKALAVVRRKPVRLPFGREVQLSSGRHNKVKKDYPQNRLNSVRDFGDKSATDAE